MGLPIKMLVPLVRTGLKLMPEEKAAGVVARHGAALEHLANVRHGANSELAESLLSEFRREAGSKGVPMAAYEFATKYGPLLTAGAYGGIWYYKNLGGGAELKTKEETKDDVLHRLEKALSAAADTSQADPNEDPMMGALERALRAGAQDPSSSSVETDPRAKAVIDLIQAYRGRDLNDGQPRMYDPNAGTQDRMVTALFDELMRLKGNNPYLPGQPAPAAPVAAAPAPVAAAPIVAPAPVAAAPAVVEVAPSAPVAAPAVIDLAPSAPAPAVVPFSAAEPAVALPDSGVSATPDALWSAAPAPAAAPVAPPAGSSVQWD